MNSGAVKTNHMNHRVPGEALIRPAAEAVVFVEPEDLFRFEGEGGPEGPGSAKALINVSLENAVSRRPGLEAKHAKPRKK